MKRLVRDRFTEIDHGDARDNLAALVRQAGSDYEHLLLLRHRVVSLAGELALTDGTDAVGGVLADMFTALETMAAMQGVQMGDVMRIKVARDTEQGTYNRGMVLTL